MRARMHESCMHILDPLRSDHALYARTSTARTMHVWAAPYKMYEAPYILPYMTGNLLDQGSVCHLRTLVLGVDNDRIRPTPSSRAIGYALTQYVTLFGCDQKSESL